MRSTDHFIRGMYPIKYSNDDERTAKTSQYISYSFKIWHDEIFADVLKKNKGRKNFEAPSISQRLEKSNHLAFGFASPYIDIGNMPIYVYTEGQINHYNMSAHFMN